MNKFVSESINDILKPKSKEEILKLIQSIHIDSIESATDHLKKGIDAASLPYVKYTLEHGAKILINDTKGMMWYVFNGHHLKLSSKLKQEIIIEFLKYSDFFKDGVKVVERDILEKTINFGFATLLNFILDNYGDLIKPEDVFKIITQFDIEEIKKHHKDSYESIMILLNWLDQNIQQKSTNELI